MAIDKNLFKDIKQYCELNGLKTWDFINSLLLKSFNIERYGDKPPFFKKNDRPPSSNETDKVPALEKMNIGEEFDEIIEEPITNTESQLIKGKSKKRKLN